MRGVGVERCERKIKSNNMSESKSKSKSERKGIIVRGVRDRTGCAFRVLEWSSHEVR